MFGLAKNPTPGLVLLLLIPAFLILSYFSLARSTNAPEPKLNAGLDHDGLPDNARSKRDRDQAVVGDRHGQRVRDPVDRLLRLPGDEVCARSPACGLHRLDVAARSQPGTAYDLRILVQ